MPKSWKKEEIKEHYGLIPCSKDWEAAERTEQHKHKIGSKGWMEEEKKEKLHYKYSKIAIFGKKLKPICKY